MKYKDFAEAEVVPEEVVSEEVVPEAKLVLDRKTGLDCRSESGTIVMLISEFK